MDGGWKGAPQALPADDRIIPRPLHPREDEEDRRIGRPVSQGVLAQGHPSSLHRALARRPRRGHPVVGDPAGRGRPGSDASIRRRSALREGPASAREGPLSGPGGRRGGTRNRSPQRGPLHRRIPSRVVDLMLPAVDAQGSRVVAFLDIGSNSVRLLLVRINPNQTYTVLAEQREVVRLGETVFVDGRIHAAAIRRTVDAVGELASLARARGAHEVVAVATSATRESENQAEFLRSLNRETGLDVRVISGKEEARLIYLGTSHMVRKEEGQAVFMDIGGGSTELAVGDQTRYAYLDSLRLGAIRLSVQFRLNREGPVPKKQYEAVRDFIRNAAAPTLK